ncbi:hypothetical protein [uncultured Mesonia sp.]
MEIITGEIILIFVENLDLIQNTKAKIGIKKVANRKIKAVNS